jgi:hypothetical protein
VRALVARLVVFSLGMVKVGVGSDSDLLSVTCARQDCDQCSMEERRCGRRGG